MKQVSKGVRNSIERGLEFLLSSRTSDGWWRDFETLAGESDEWVTAYVASCIAHVPEGERAASQALDQLLTRRRDAGWGYNQRVPSDCDTTAWVCRLIELLGWTVLEEYQSGIRFLREAIYSNGGVPTYSSEIGIRQFTGIGTEVSFDGWTKPHACVTANVAGLKAFKNKPQLGTYLRSARDINGSWSGYWWIDRAYPTMLAAEALDTDASSRQWAIQSEEDSPFCLACRSRLGAETVAPLIDAQQEDGSWPSSARLRIPAPFVIDPTKVRSRISLDQNRTYVTATAVLALSEYVR